MSQSYIHVMHSSNHAYRILIAGFLILYGAGFHRAVAAQSDVVAAGEQVAQHSVQPGRPACAACHMADGAGQPDVGIPRLAGLTASYIEDQLGFFASGKRENAVMSPYARALSAAQRLQVAAYFASLPLPPPADLPHADPSVVKRGQNIFLNGDEGTGLLACAQCHGSTGLGVGEFSPRLAGQSAPYIMEQLDGWHRGILRDPKGAFMQSISAHLTKPDIAAVAAFIATLPPEGMHGQ